jgi:hypothetical protein
MPELQTLLTGLSFGESPRWHDGRTLFLVATGWGGAQRTAELAGTGQILMTEAPAPRVGWP